MTGWVIEGLAASAVLMALVLAIRGPVRRAFGANVAYALWALPVLRLALPPLPQTLPQAIRHAAIAPVAQASEPVAVLLSAPAGGAVRIAAQAFDWTSIVPVLAVLWLIGAVAFAGFHILAHRRFCRDLLADAAPLEARGDIAVIETPAARGPLAFGILQRYVVFPADFSERYDDAERDLALAHELGHHARGDLVANWIALAVLALHWFNPVAWYAFRAFRTDQEMANDARVLAGRPAITRHTYACAILKAAHGGAVSAACHLHTIDDLKGRLRMLTTRRMSRTRLAGGAATVALVGAVALGLTASGTQAAEHVRAKVRTVTGVDLTALDRMPLLPAMPSMPAMGAMVADLPVIDGARGTAAGGHAPVIYVEPPRTSDTPVEPPSSPKNYVEPPSAPDLSFEPRPPAAPVAPMAPRITAASEKVVIVDGREMRRHVARIANDGITTDDTFANLPQVTSANCGTSADRPLVIRTMEGGKRHITVCNDRIERASARADVMAANGAALQRIAYRSALAGLRRARVSLSGNVHMPADGRREALASVDQSIAEIEADIARTN